jgi:hypothetical protein
MKKINSIGYVFLLIFCLSNNQLSNEINSETISNIDIRKVNATDGYYQLSYSIEPSCSTAIPSYSLTCSNSGIDPTDYYTVSLDTSNKTCSVTNFAACAYQCELSIYSGDVSASITLDYLKRVTGINAYFDGDESEVTFTSSVKYGTGSVSPSYSVEDESLTLNSTFVTNAKAILYPTTDYSDLIYYGFTGDKSSYLDDFSLYSLTYNLYAKYTSYSIVNGSLKTTSVTSRLSSFSSTTDYEELFQGYFSTFDYVGYVNNVSYSKSLCVQVLRD